MAVIYITGAGGAPLRFRLPDEPGRVVTIGRAESCSLCLPEVVGLSRLHCSLFPEGGRYFIRDEGSTNGTLADGCAIGTEVLRPGVAYLLGNATLSFAEEGPEGVSPSVRKRGHRSGAGQFVLLLFLMALAFFSGMALRCWVQTGAFPPVGAEAVAR